MESFKKQRTPLRSGFTRIANNLAEYLKDKNPDFDEIEILINQLNEKWCVLDSKEKDIHELLANDPECSQEIFDSEYNDYELYKEKYIRIKTKVDKILSTTVDNRSYVSEMASKRRFKLPKIELKKFNGEIKEWLGFWGQFKKIHDDIDMAPEDKFIYLFQSTVEGSRARELVESFPPSAENYEQAIECLKARFGREDLLIEVYVRELLSLVLCNSMSEKKTRLASLYDKIESHIRALNSLGVTSDKYASILYPLVESCLPEDIIRVWERNMTLKNETVKESNKLTALMSFLKSEVEGEERITIAKEGFGFESRRKMKHPISPFMSSGEEKIPTATGLFDATHSNKQLCVFCEKNHESWQCRYALKMNLEDKKKILFKKGCCFICLKAFHRARDCKSRINCERCKRRHSTIMCNEDLKKELNNFKTEATENNDAEVVINDTTLSNRTCSRHILLQTLYVRLRGKNEDKVIRCLIDSGSQRSYLSKRVAKEMGYDSIKEEKVIHNLFGGKEHTENHYRYRVLVSSINRKFHCNFEVLDQEKICSKIPPLKLGSCSQELHERNIIVTDQLIEKVRESSDIELLIGADVAGKLLNGKVVPLSCGLVAVGTHLGWTLMGKMPFDDFDDNSTMVVTNLFVKDTAISDLWDLDVIDITDPIAKKNVEEKNLLMKLQFQNSVSLNEEGRYEVMLPWAEERLPLPTNKDLALKRLEKTTQKLYARNLLKRYDEVFKNWQDINIIEEVKQEENTGDFGHYLSHRPVFKENSSTPVGEEYKRKIMKKLRQSFYVDNVLASLQTEAELFIFIKESRKVMESAKLKLRCWQYSNDPNPEVNTNLLGLIWNREKDVIKLNLKWIEYQPIEKVTKRFILAVAHEVFDPVGFVSPDLLLKKLMLQSLWRCGISWDAEVDENTKENFRNWFRDLIQLKEITIPRWIDINEENRKFCSIHTFCDASGNAYAAALFLRVKTSSGVKVHLLASKSRVALVKPISIPRLELIAATVGARLCASVLEGLQWQKVELIFWTDSTAVLTWIQKEEILTIFVANGVREIRRLTHPNAWRYIKETENPADLPSRGCSVKQLLAVKWWEGPTWLKKKESEWPTCNFIFNPEDVNDLVALSPSMFLQETRECGVPDIDKVDTTYMRKRYLYLQKVREDLRKRFRLEYLGQLQYDTKHKHDSKSVSVGEIVLIGSDNLKRLQWPIGRVVEVLPGKDGTVRVVRLKTKSGILTRPVQRVYSLELSDNIEGTILRGKVLTDKQSEKNKKSDNSITRDEHHQKPQVITRRGRVVNPPKKLNL